jgi:hypothetical protein
MLKFLKNFEKNTEILHKKPKIKKYSLQPKHILKAFLRWLRLRDQTGELLIKEDTDINKILAEWNKNLIQWLVSIIVTGFLVLMALIPFYTPQTLIQIPILIFSFGIGWYMIMEFIKDIKNSIRRS